MTDLDSLAEFCTVRQSEILEAVITHGSIRKAAKALGLARSTIGESMSTVRSKAAARVITEHSSAIKVPAGYAIKGTTTLRKNGEEVMQWVKTDRDESASQQVLIDFANSLGESVKGLAPFIPKPNHVHEDLMCVIPIGDPHFGLRVWAQEGGDNFDLNIAESLTQGAIDRLIASAPPAKTALLLNLGDTVHADSQSNTTTAGTTVDVDGRWAKIQQVALRSMLYCVKRLLERHEKVIFRLNRGNHDKHAAYALSLMISCYFHDEPRVEVDLSPSAVWYYQFGKTLIGSTHGDTIKEQNLIGVMAADRAEQWGLTKHRYWYVGHVHHVNKKEYPGGVVEYFRTLAAGDAWHHGQGYRSGRDMCLIVLHKDHGEVERHRCDIGMIV